MLLSLFMKTLNTTSLFLLSIDSANSLAGRSTVGFRYFFLGEFKASVFVFAFGNSSSLFLFVCLF